MPTTFHKSSPASEDLVLVPLWAVRDRTAVVAGVAEVITASGYDQDGRTHELRLDRSTCDVRIDDHQAHLSLREFLILEALLHRRGRTLTPGELVRILDSVLSERGSHATPWTLRHCISTLRSNLGPVFAEHVVSEHRRGYIWRDDATTP